MPRPSLQSNKRQDGPGSDWAPSFVVIKCLRRVIEPLLHGRAYRVGSFISIRTTTWSLSRPKLPVDPNDQRGTDAERRSTFVILRAFGP
jgi:hypothetical protein